MKKSKHTATVEAPRARREGRSTWHYLLGFVIALIVAFEVYGPALTGPFVFDDSYLPFLNPNLENEPLSRWLGVRPLLMVTFWLNQQTSGVEPYAYHAVNVLLHVINGLLMFFAIRKLLELAGESNRLRSLLALFGAGLFLLHPVQTESVAYVASRSESLSLLFFLGAFLVFLHRKSEQISWLRAATVLALFGAAVTTKEHTVALPALLILTDLFFGGFRFESLKRNWRLYVPMAAAGAVGGVFVWRVLQRSFSAGFAMKDLPWHDYFFTQCRAIWTYVRLYLFPAAQNADYDFPISRSIADPATMVGLIALIAGAAAAWKYRDRYRLAAYGYFAFLLLLAPTSSFVPIKDVLVERRLYLPFIGLLLITIDLLRRWRTTQFTLATALSVVLAVSAMLSYQRNQVWGSPLSLWQDTVAKSPKKVRPRFQLAFEYFQQGRCNEAVQHYDAASRIERPDHKLLVNWGLALECASQPQQALAKFEQAAQMQATGHVYSLIGMLHAKKQNWDGAMKAFESAERVEPAYDMTYVYRAITYRGMGQEEKAVAEFRRALAINPQNRAAREGLAQLGRQS